MHFTYINVWHFIPWIDLGWGHPNSSRAPRQWNAWNLWTACRRCTYSPDPTYPAPARSWTHSPMWIWSPRSWSLRPPGGIDPRRGVSWIWKKIFMKSVSQRSGAIFFYETTRHVCRESWSDAVELLPGSALN